MRGAVALLLSLFFALMVGVMCVPGANISIESEGERAGEAIAPTPSPVTILVEITIPIPTTAEGEVTETTTAKSADGRASVTIPAGIKTSVTKITIKPL